MSASGYLSSDSSEHLPRSAFEDVNVSQIYDDLGLDYEQYIIDDPGRAKSIEWTISKLAEEEHGTHRDREFYIVDLGCASGRPTVETLAHSLRDQSIGQGLSAEQLANPKTKHVVVGVDISTVQLGHARRRVTANNPIAQFEQGDIRIWQPPTSLVSDRSGIDAVLSFYALNHLPLEDFHTVIQRMAQWLRPGGLLVLGSVAHVNGRVKWLGHEVAATSLPLHELKDIVERSGCVIEQAWEEEWYSTGRQAVRPKVNQFILAVKS